MKFEPTYLKRSYCFVVPSFAQYFNELVAKIYCHLHVNKLFLQALNSFDLDVVAFSVFFCFVLRFFWGGFLCWMDLPRIRIQAH